MRAENKCTIKEKATRTHLCEERGGGAVLADRPHGVVARDDEPVLGGALDLLIRSIDRGMKFRKQVLNFMVFGPQSRR